MEGNGDKKRRMAQLRFSLSVLSATAQLIIHRQRRTDKYKDKDKKDQWLSCDSFLSVLSATAQHVIQDKDRQIQREKKMIAILFFSFSSL